MEETRYINNGACYVSNKTHHKKEDTRYINNGACYVSNETCYKKEETCRKTQETHYEIELSRAVHNLFTFIWNPTSVLFSEFVTEEVIKQDPTY